MRKTATILAALFVLASAGGAPAAAQSFGDGIAAYSLQDYQRAREIWQGLAKHGNVEAQFRLGLLYRDGRGIEANPALAADWLRLAGGNGHAGASYILADMYAAGAGVEEDPYQAFEWYLMAAEQGDPRAQVQTGILFLDGEITSSDWVQAHVWFARAARGLPDGDSRILAETARDRTYEALTEEERAEARDLLGQQDTLLDTIEEAAEK